MNKTDEVIELYLQEIRNAIHNIVPCETFIEGLRQELQDALNSSGDCTLEELISQFGNPETLAKEFLEETEEFQPKKIAKSKRKRNIIIGALIVILVASLGYLYVIHSHTQAKPVQTIETIEE
ncbi:hypothetical protein [Emergencia timonensis]|uniref:hypothetical protein n=1 Tax=Emergencia timonensis TaxID=1776384 RepID=UPI00399661E9